LDFLGSSLFRYENPESGRLDFLGFPWILSSKTRLINGLHGIFAETFFLALFPLARIVSGWTPRDLEAAEGRIVHGTSLRGFCFSARNCLGGSFSGGSAFRAKRAVANARCRL
jgi:hypothetical protein